MADLYSHNYSDAEDYHYLETDYTECLYTFCLC